MYDHYASYSYPMYAGHRTAFTAAQGEIYKGVSKLLQLCGTFIIFWRHHFLQGLMTKALLTISGYDKLYMEFL